MLDKNRVVIVILFLIVFDLCVWVWIFCNQPIDNLNVYFFDVGQGDSQMVVLAGGPKILIDGGPDNRVVGELDKTLGASDRYIDLIILSHPQLDHFTGLIDVVKRYQVGVFIFNGEETTSAAFMNLQKTLKENKIPVLVLSTNDKIKYQDSQLDILWPLKNSTSISDTNDNCLVLKLMSEQAGILFTGDIGAKLENLLASQENLDIDILKVSHHGSKFSSTEEFLKKITPVISVIEVGKNSYGHPTKEVLNNLALVGSQIFRTDQNGTVKLTIKNGKIEVFKRK